MNANNHLHYEIKRVSTLLETLTNEVRADARAEHGDTAAMIDNPVCRNILSVIGAWLWETDEKHRIKFVSPQFRKITGCDPEFFLHRMRSELANEQLISNINENSHKFTLSLKKEFQDYVYSVSVPTIGQKWFNVSGRPRFEIKTSKFLGYWGVGFDCTNRRESEFSEARRLAEFGHAFDALDVSILILDPEYRISYRNQRWLALHSRLESEVTDIGVRYEDYLRASIQSDLFPEASGNKEKFIRDRISKNISPPEEAFPVERQDGLLISTKVSKIMNNSTLIISSILVGG